MFFEPQMLEGSEAFYCGRCEKKMPTTQVSEQFDEDDANDNDHGDDVAIYLFFYRGASLFRCLLSYALI